MTEATALFRLGAAALSWIESNLSRFGVSASGDDLTLVEEVKPLAELSLACDLISRTGVRSRFGRQFISFSKDVLANCWDELDRGEHLRHLLLRYPDLFSLVTVYPPFRRAGFRNADLDRSIESIVEDPGIRALEFPAWRLIDFAVALRALGFRSPWRPAEEFGRTWLGQAPPPWMMSESAAYSLTHTVFYMTDFGFMPEGLPKRARVYVSKWFGPWSRYFARAPNFDLLGEFLMVGYCLDIKQVPDLLKYLLAAQGRNGAVCGPEAILTNLGSRVSEKQRRFLRDYHTTLVALMASVLGLRTSRGHR